MVFEPDSKSTKCLIARDDLKQENKLFTQISYALVNEDLNDNILTAISNQVDWKIHQISHILENFALKWKDRLKRLQ